MQVLALLIVGLVVVLQLPSEGEAICCGFYAGGQCNDCTYGTPYCAYGRCNIFGCNCDGGCRRGTGRGCPRGRRSLDDVAPFVSRDARDVIRRADTDGDGRMSLEEGHALVADMGFPMHRVKRDMNEMDLDNDQFLSAGEIDPEFM